MKCQIMLMQHKLFCLVFLSKLTIFNFASVGKDNSQVGSVKYLRTDDGYLIENLIQTAEQDVHLEDFFWTGSGDGPPGPLRPVSSPPIQNTIVRTATILATVYVDGNFDSDFDPLCIVDCDKNSGNTNIHNVPPTDRRYWLLTVVAGLFRNDDFPILEDKLAKLYRVAFLRQQARHLGIINGNNKTNFTFRRKRFNYNSESKDSAVAKRFKRNDKNVRKNVEDESATKLSDKIQKYHETKNNFQKVKVFIHNITTVSSDEESSIDKNDINHKEDNKTAFVNQTEIIYSVFMGNFPVLAKNAAEDMRHFISNKESEQIMENLIVLKAEPWLKEPTATPLVPSVNGNFSLIFEQGPLITIIMCAVLILLVLLIIMFLIFGKAKKNKLNAESKRAIATQALVQKINVDEDIQKIRSEESPYNDKMGVDNMAYEKESKRRSQIESISKIPPTIHFPLPPVDRPSSCSSSSTSDSSVYYPKRRSKPENIEELLRLKNCHGRKSFMNDDEFYTKVSKNSFKSSVDERQNFNKKHKRKYKENKVSSIEHVQSPQLSSYLSEKELAEYPEEDTSHKMNSSSQFHDNMIMSDKNFTAIETSDKSQSEQLKETSKSPIATEAINSDLINQIGRQHKFDKSDNASIGSFLSMASIKSFPRYSMPVEPLTKVLEPVSVTHLDHSDPDYETLKNTYKLSNSQKSLNMSDEHIFDPANDELSRTHSDAADPGVLGPIVWEIHRKELADKSKESPIRDPFQSRNRFEGLLEGAMKLYGSPKSHEFGHQNEEICTENLNVPGSISKSKETRGKSAATSRISSKTPTNTSKRDLRPKTANTLDNKNQTLFEKTKSTAWHSGTGTPLYRETEMLSPNPFIDAIQKELNKFSKNEFA